MSESDEIRLFCWVLGDPHDRVFEVSIKLSATIVGLKKAIQEQKPSFKDISHDSIVPYKFQLPVEDFNEDYAQSINLEDGQKLTWFRNISFYWTIEPTMVLSVILPRPAGATISPSSSQNLNISPPSWLVEIHSELWGRRDLLGKIFRTATVTKGDFTELQNLLESLNPERNSDEYVLEDVLVTKSAFLRKRSTGLFDLDLAGGLVPRPVFQASCSDVVDEDGIVGDDNVIVDDDVMDDDDDGDVVDGDDDDAAMVIDSDNYLPDEATAIFPYTIRYVDLTVLQSKENLRVPRLVLFRNEWDTMIDIFNKRVKGTYGSALFSGQPGIGKTCMLHCILILCIILARPIVFQDMTGMVFIIGDTVRPLGAPFVSDDADDVLALVDADKVCQPNDYLFRHREYRLLVTSSPRKKEDRRWLIQSVKDRLAMFIMKPWSREELVALLFLHGKDITLKRLQEASCICGNIPRECFTAAVSPLHLRDAKYEIRNSIAQTVNLSYTVLDMRVGGDTVIHRAFQIRPLSEDRLLSSCLVEPVSDWAFLEMMDVLDKRRAGSAYDFYCAIKGTPDSAALAGRMFENYLHEFLKTSSRTFTIESLDDRSATLEIRFTSDRKRFGDMKCFSGNLALSVKSETSCYLQPLSPVFPSFDSFLYQPGISQSGFSCLIALQATTAADHAIKIKGLEDVQTSLKANMKHLRPTIKRKMIILFVVPDILAEIFAKQTIEGAKQAIKDTKKKGKEKEKEPLWYRKTAQYILALSEEEVFKATSR